MPLYQATRIQGGHVTGRVELDSPDDDMAYSEAHEGLDVYRGEWAEVKRITAKPENNDE